MKCTKNTCLEEGPQGGVKMKILAVNPNIYKTKNTPISFKGDHTNEAPKTTQFEKNLKPTVTKTAPKGSFSNIVKAVKDFFETDIQSTISTSTIGLF